jgi:hypothetical protein
MDKTCKLHSPLGILLWHRHLMAHYARMTSAGCPANDGTRRDSRPAAVTL